MKSLRDFVGNRYTTARKSEHDDIRSVVVLVELVSQSLTSFVSVCKSAGQFAMVSCSHGAVSPCL